MFSEYVAAVALLLLLFYYLKRPKNHLKNVPGPRPNILFGNLLDAITPRHKLLSVITGYIAKYGNTVKVQLGPFKEVILTSDPKLIEVILSSTKFVGKSTQYKAFEKWLGNSVLISTASSWKKQRRMLMSSFHLSVLSRYIDVFERNGSILVNKLWNEVDKDSVEIYQYMNLCTLDVVCEAAMGTSVNAQTADQSEFVTSLATMTNIILARIIIPLPDWLYCFTPLYFIQRRALKVYHSYTEGVIDKRIASLKDENEENDDESFGEKRRLDILDLLLKADMDGRPLNRTEIRNQVDTLMFGGQDTTASTLSFVLHCLAHHPDVQNEAYEEQKMLFGSNTAPDMIMRDLQNMKYLETVIKESMRMYPTIPFMGRRIAEQIEWDGMVFPENTDIMLYIYGIHNNPDIFPEPDRFNPDRFKEGADKYQYAFIPFSAGPRNCMGKMFGMLEMKSIISKILRNFEVHPSIPDPELKVWPKIVLTPVNGCHVSFKKR